MFRVYYDCEFIEGSQTKRFFGMNVGATKPTIDLISIGMVREDGQEYYAISKDFNLKEAWNRYDIKTEKVYGDTRNIFPEGRKKKVYWIRENVLLPIWRELVIKSEDEWFAYSSEGEYKEFLKEVRSGDCDYKFTYKSLKKLIEKYGKTNKDIAEEVQTFCLFSKISIDNIKRITPIISKLELYGYYSAYDHIALCWLFGKMIDLPKGFPMYTIDLKQMFDGKQKKWERLFENKKDHTILQFYTDLKKHDFYPKQENEHNALADARWNKKLHEFLENL